MWVKVQLKIAGELYSGTKLYSLLYDHDIWVKSEELPPTIDLSSGIPTERYEITIYQTDPNSEPIICHSAWCPFPGVIMADSTTPSVALLLLKRASQND